MSLELAGEIINIGSIKKGNYFPFFFYSMTEIYKILKENSDPYYNLKDFQDLAKKVSMKPWNYFKRLKEVILTYFPVMILKSHDNHYVIPTYDRNEGFFEILHQILYGSNAEETCEDKDQALHTVSFFSDAHASSSIGRKALYEKYPMILELISEKLGTVSVSAEGRRRDSIGYVSGITLKELKSYIETNLANKFNIMLDANKQTYRRYLLPPRSLSLSSKNYKKLIEAKMYCQENDLTFNSEDQHWARAQITYIYTT